MKKIFIISAYPDQESFGTNLVSNYLKESLANGHQVILFDLAKSTFDPILHHGYKQIQALEDELVTAQKNIIWADHLVFFFPIWWGGAPAILKGFFDRTFLPGFAFNYTGKFLPNQLLRNKYPLLSFEAIKQALRTATRKILMQFLQRVNNIDSRRLDDDIK